MKLLRRLPSGTLAKAAVATLAVVVALVAVFVVRAPSDAEAACGPGFHRLGTRCCATLGDAPAPGVCPRTPPDACPPGLVVTPFGCDAPADDRVRVERTTVLVGPSDWEAEGRVAARTIQAGPFFLDRYEMTVGRAFCPRCPMPRPDVFDRVDPGRAASDVSWDEAASICRARGGRLPTEDEWIVAAAGDEPRRYPWGNTGAVCRRAAWGLAIGPCGRGASTPDSVGAHPDGATPSGIFDLAGNVAEWLDVVGVARAAPVSATPASAIDAAVPPCGDRCGVVRGGSFDTALATDLRTWRRSEVPKDARRPHIGFRCAYDVALR